MAAAASEDEREQLLHSVRSVIWDSFFAMTRPNVEDTTAIKIPTSLSVIK